MRHRILFWTALWTIRASVNCSAVHSVRMNSTTCGVMFSAPSRSTIARRPRRSLSLATIAQERFVGMRPARVDPLDAAAELSLKDLDRISDHGTHLRVHRGVAPVG